MCHLAALGQDGQNEGREIQTPNLLIWSQTRYRCAIPPHGNVAVSACHWNCTSCANSLASRKAAWGILATRTQAQAAHVRIEHPDQLRYCGSPVQPTANRSRKANGNCSPRAPHRKRRMLVGKGEHLHPWSRGYDFSLTR